MLEHTFCKGVRLTDCGYPVLTVKRSPTSDLEMLAHVALVAEGSPPSFRGWPTSGKHIRNLDAYIYNNSRSEQLEWRTFRVYADITTRGRGQMPMECSYAKVHNRDACEMRV